MKKISDIRPPRETGDVVLREVRRAKDTLSAAYGHDLDKLFEETRKHEELSGHPLIRLDDLRKHPAKGRAK